ncbi:hypothetical protein CHU95_05265 [Niveispirillum lacus]|uniref:Uncharacterized protein n=1 Tax=Niveispirillum lacus TaxID=1981099 RepID=A0A255Z6D6_9PROT|nr:contractile injection system tape measure protein [Niveispirillum lacus]OYQ36200.1 hypothetical protein CHU95_05265 [Niveispirillum lacus]
MITAPPSPHHLVARLVWDSAYDHPSSVREQQDWLSDFSHRLLPDLLARVFDRCCPTGQTWRCEHLEVDLGPILLSRASHDLPHRLATELTSALWRRFGSVTDAAPFSPGDTPQSPGATGDRARTAHDDIDLTDQDILALLEHLLLHGALPWWQKNRIAFLSLWTLALERDRPALQGLLRRIAVQEKVRLRLIWLLGLDRLPHLIMLADPTHADALVHWVNDLVARHLEDRLVQDDTTGFERAAWLALLTCLFTDRGSLFNLTDFARAHLRHLARHYGIAYETLLDRLARISERAAPTLPPRFLKLIRSILAIDLPVFAAGATASPTEGPVERDWHDWSQMLSRGQAERHINAHGSHAGGRVRFQTLFRILAARDGRRMVRTMLAAGAPAGPVLARFLDDPSLRRTVTLLQPNEAEFILAHVAHSQHLAQQRHWPRRAVWAVVLTFLLSEHTSRFERRLLVERTLREGCQRHGTDLATALDLLIAYAQVAGSDPRHYVLLQILLDLQAGLGPLAAGPTTRYRNRTTHRRAPDLAPPHGPAADDLDSEAALTAAQTMLSTGALPVCLVWKALRWRLRMGRTTTDLPAILRHMPLAGLWALLPSADLRRWLRAQPDRAHLLPQLSNVPAARRWLSRLVPPALRPVETLVDQAARWFGSAGQPPAPRPLLEPVLWQLALDPRGAAIAPPRFLAHCLLLWCQRLGRSVAATAMRGLAAPPSPLWQQAFGILLDWTEGHAIALPAPTASGKGRHEPPDAWGQWLATPQGQAQLVRLLCRQAAPALHRRHGISSLPAVGAPEQRLAMALYQWAWTRPDGFRRLLSKPWRRQALRPRLEARLRAALSLSHLLDLTGREPSASPSARRITRLVSEWQAWQRRLNLPHADRRETWLWRIVWQAWLDQDWRALEPARMLAAFRQFFLPQVGLNAAQLDIRLLAAQPPAAIRSAFPPHKLEKPTMASSPDATNTLIDNQRLKIANAGLVLLQSYLPILFDRLGLVRDQHFVSVDAQQRAVLALQVLATGFAEAEEPFLVLNKVLCGLQPADPVPVRADFTATDRAMMDSLLQAVIGHWPRCGASSLDGFRGNWLVRDGVLSDSTDHWNLTVQRRAYDLLLIQSPFSYAVIKLPWMAKALYVTWPT